MKTYSLTARPSLSLGGSPTSTTSGATTDWGALGTTSNPAVTQPGTYTVTVTDPSNGCVAQSTVIITQNITVPTVNAGADVTLTCAVTNATLGGNPTTPVPNATYQWTGGGNNPTKFVATPGNYCVTVTNPINGCSAFDCVDVFQNITQPNANAGADALITCATPNVTLGVASTTPNVTYLWSITPGAVTPTISVAAVGTYTVTVTDSTNGCIMTDAVVVTQNTVAPIAFAGADQTLTCANICVNIGATSSTPNVNYLWSNGSTLDIQNVCTAGTYTVTITATVNGCLATDVVVVSQNITQPNANAGLDAIITCNSSVATIGVVSTTSGVSYQWDGGPTPTGATQIVNTAGTYCVTVTDLTNGCLRNDCVTVTQNITPPVADAGLPNVVTCANPTRQIGTAATPNTSYVWGSSLGGLLGFVTSNTLAQPTVSQAATYCKP